jgi:hypothetical protein
MRVIAQSPDPLTRMHTMTGKKVKSGTIDVKALLAGDEEFLRALVRTALEEVLEAEMTEALGAEKGERTAGRMGGFVSTCARWRIPVVVGYAAARFGDEAECGARHVDQRPSGIGQSARRMAIAGSAAVTAASSSTSAVPAF